MTEVPLLRDYTRSRAVLVGTSVYEHLTHVPAALNSLCRMYSLLTGPMCGWPSDQVTLLDNEQRPGDLPDRLVSLFADAADVALFYYVGHGQIDEDDQLCLGLGGSVTEPHRRATTSLGFDTVRRALVRSPATTKILILDCCFAGLATRRQNTLGLTDEAVDLTADTGAYTIAAASAYSTAWFETGPKITKPQTYFTKYFADLVEAGIPGQPPGLRLHPLFTRLRENLARDKRPRPSARSVDEARDFVFARNAAPPQPQVDPAAEIERIRKELAEREQELARLRSETSTEAEVLTPQRVPRIDRRTMLAGALAGFATAGIGLVIALNQPENPPQQRTFSGHTDGVYAVAFSPDGKTLASAGGDKGVRLWDVATGQTTATLTGHTDTVQSLAFSPDGKYLASGGLDRSVRLWSPATGQTTNTYPDSSHSVLTVTFSPNSKYLAIGLADGAIRLRNMDMTANATAFARHSAAVHSVAFSPDGTILASCGDDKLIKLWDVGTGQSIGTLTGYTTGIRSIAFSPNGKTLVSGGDDNAVRLWDVSSR